jgi:hypothetical protein
MLYLDPVTVALIVDLAVEQQQCFQPYVFL